MNRSGLCLDLRHNADRLRVMRRCQIAVVIAEHRNPKSSFRGQIISSGIRYTHHHPGLVKEEISFGSFAAQKIRTTLGVFLYMVAGGLEWQVHPIVVIAIFIFMVACNAPTSRGVRLGR